MKGQFTHTRYQEVDIELAHMQAYLEALAQEIRDKTVPGRRYSHLWSQADNSVGYIQSLRMALKSEQGEPEPL